VILLRTFITGYRPPTEHRPAELLQLTVGRAFLGTHVWFMLEQSRHSMTIGLKAAWAQRMSARHLGVSPEESAQRAIADYAEVRGEKVTDAAEVTRVLQGVGR
jgi:hypothetical protein